jgi:hypothetical protein
MDWARGKPILSAAGPAPRMFVAPKGAVYVGNFLGLRGSMKKAAFCARHSYALCKRWLG